MIFEGIKLMFVGMGMVFAFLWMIVFCIKLTSVLTRKHAERELEAIERGKTKIAKAKKAKLEKDKTPSVLPESDHIAAITAAVAAFEMERSSNG